MKGIIKNRKEMQSFVMPKASYELSCKRTYSAMIAVIWSHSMFSQYRGFLTHFPFVGKIIAPFIISVIILLLMIANYRQTRKNYAPMDFTFFIFAIGIFLLNYLVFPENEKVLNDYASPYLIGTLPFFFAGIVFDVDERTEKTIYWTSVFDLLVLAAYYLLYVQETSYSGETKIMEDMMGPAYAALPFILIIIRKLFIKFDILSLILTILGFLFLLSFGTRGPVACLLVFVLAYHLLLKMYKRPVLVISIIALVGVLLFINIDAILGFLFHIILKLGMGTRVLEYAQAVVLLGGQDAADTSILDRQDMMNVASGNFTFFGHGIGSFSRVAHSDYHYSHNIIIDFLIEYGILFGSLLLIGLFVLFYKSWKVSENESGKSFVLVLFCTGFVSLLFSMTYLIKPEFFFALGYCMHYMRKKTPKHAHNKSHIVLATRG